MRRDVALATPFRKPALSSRRPFATPAGRVPNFPFKVEIAGSNPARVTNSEPKSADGAALRVVPVHEDTLEETGGRLVIPASGVTIGDELVQALRNADRR